MTKVDALLVQSSGLIWAVRREGVVSVRRDGGRITVQLRRGELAVEEVLGVQEGLAVCPVAATLRRFLPLACVGLTVFNGAPAALLDDDFGEEGPIEGGFGHGR